jgi:serine/threonine protein phosphatase PrpC
MLRSRLSRGVELKESLIAMPHLRGSRRRRLASYLSAREAPFVFSAWSIPCERHPERNEDSFLADPATGLAAVFDGVGGSAAGEIAARTAARFTHQGWKKLLCRLQQRSSGGMLLEQADADHHELLQRLREVLEEVDELIRTEGAQLAGTDDLATTVALGVFCPLRAAPGAVLFYAHVGDSRIYLLRPGEPLKRLTTDDGLLGKLVESKVLKDSDAMRIDQAMHFEDLSDLELSYFRWRGGITQALGGPLAPTIHVDEIPIYPGDRLLFCTDGIHDNLTDEEIAAILKTSPRSTVARELAERSLQRSREERLETIRAKPDDITAVVVTCRF